MTASRPRRSLTLLALAVLGLLLTACGGGSSSVGSDRSGAGGGETPTVRIARTGYFDPIALAQQDGSLDRAITEAGGTATYTAPFGAFAPVAQALNSGAVDIGVGSITSALGGFAGTPGYTIFAAQAPNEVDEGIVVPKGSSIRTVRDLVGRRVAVNKAGTGEYLVRKALAEEGIAASEVELDYLPPPQAAPAFASGKLDAWASFGSFTGTARAVNGGRFIATGGQIGSQNSVIFVVRNAFLKEQPALVRAVFDAARAESEKIRSDPAAATARGNETAKLPAPVAAIQTEAYSRQAPLTPIDGRVRAEFQQVADFFRAQGVIAKPIDIGKQVVDVRTLKAPTR